VTFESLILMTMSFLRLLPNSTLQLNVHAKPGARVSQITAADGPSLEIQIAARAVEGAANAELVDYLASVLKIKRRNISIVSGDKSRDKILHVSSADSEYVLQTLLAESKT